MTRRSGGYYQAGSAAPKDPLRRGGTQGEQLFAALKYLGRTVEMLRYPGESHGMSGSGLAPRAPFEGDHRVVQPLLVGERFSEESTSETMSRAICGCARPTDATSRWCVRRRSPRSPCGSRS